MTKKVAVRGVLKLLDTLVEPTQENAPRLVRRGRMRASIGDFRDAIADLSLAIDLDSTLGEAYLNRAIVRLRLNQFDEALRDIECDLKLRTCFEIHV